MIPSRFVICSTCFSPLSAGKIKPNILQIESKIEGKMKLNEKNRVRRLKCNTTVTIEPKSPLPSTISFVTV